MEFILVQCIFLDFTEKLRLREGLWVSPILFDFVFSIICASATRVDVPFPETDNYWIIDNN